MQGPRHHRDGARPGRADARLPRDGAAERRRRSGEAGARGVTHNGLQIDFRVVEPDQFGNVLQHLTGSKQHNVELREYAVRRGMHVSEYGVEEDETGKVHRCPTEEQVYEVLGLPYIEPELREGRGELQAAIAGKLPALVTEADLKGDLHAHTTLSDGRSTLQDMAQAAQKRGYKYLARHRPLRLARVRQRRAGGRAAAAGRARARPERADWTASRCWPAPR